MDRGSGGEGVGQGVTHVYAKPQELWATMDLPQVTLGPFGGQLHAHVCVLHGGVNVVEFEVAKGSVATGSASGSRGFRG